MIVTSIKQKFIHQLKKKRVKYSNLFRNILKVQLPYFKFCGI